jgi:hypothetical protein
LRTIYERGALNVKGKTKVNLLMKRHPATYALEEFLISPLSFKCFEGHVLTSPAFN